MFQDILTLSFVIINTSTAGKMADLYVLVAVVGFELSADWPREQITTGEFCVCDLKKAVDNT